MKKVKTVLGLMVITLMTAICMTLLVVIYKDEDGEFLFFQETTVLTEDGLGYQEGDSGEHFKSFIINRKDMSFVELNINGAYVKFSNEALWIQDNLMIQGSQINRNFAVYDDCVLVFPFTYKYKVYGGIVIYNIYTGEYDIVEKINKMYVDVTDLDQIITFMDGGFSVDLKNVDNYLVMDNGETFKICKYKGKLKLARASVIYLYDSNDKMFDDTETISEMGLKEYIAVNKYC